MPLLADGLHNLFHSFRLCATCIHLVPTFCSTSSLHLRFGLPDVLFLALGSILLFDIRRLYDVFTSLSSVLGNAVSRTCDSLQAISACATNCNAGTEETEDQGVCGSRKCCRTNCAGPGTFCVGDQQSCDRTGNGFDDVDGTCPGNFICCAPRGGPQAAPGPPPYPQPNPSEETTPPPPPVTYKTAQRPAPAPAPGTTPPSQTPEKSPPQSQPTAAPGTPPAQKEVQNPQPQPERPAKQPPTVPPEQQDRPDDANQPQPTGKGKSKKFGKSKKNKKRAKKHLKKKSEKKAKLRKGGKKTKY